MPEKDCYQGETFAGFDPGPSLKDTEYQDCVFKACRWQGVHLENCSFLGCTFDHCQFSDIHFTFCKMRDAWLEGCAFRGIGWGALQGRGGLGQPIGKAINCSFRYNQFVGMALGGFDFSRNQFSECLFDDCKLAEADFNGAGLGRTAFTRCDLQNADFRAAQEYLIDPNQNKLKGARFSFPDVVTLLDGLGLRIE